MRDFRIDYTNKENPLLDGNNAGNKGEHNATRLIITPPEEMANCADIAIYKVAFELTNNRVVHSNLIEKADTVEMLIPQQITSSATIGIQLEGYGADGELIAKSSKLSKIFFSKSVCGTEVDYKGEPFGVSVDISANTLARHTHDNVDVLNEFGENEAGKPTYKGEPIGIGSVTAERPTETKTFLNDFSYEPNMDISSVLNQILYISAIRDVQNDLSGKEIIKIELNFDDDESKWVDIKDLIHLIPESPYMINANRSFQHTDELKNDTVCFGVLYFGNASNAVYTAIQNQNQYGFRVTYYAD